MIANGELVQKLRDLLGEPECELHFKNKFELLMSVMLSAQCTDRRVNMVTPMLFQKFGMPQLMAEARQEDVEMLIHSCGFYRNKAKNMIAASKDIAEKFGGEVPGNVEDLIKLRGVGNKTANVVAAVGFKKDAIAVDTHVFRVSNRLGITKAKTPFECEKQLEKFFEKNTWSEAHHLLLHFGRYHCMARSPKCEGCIFEKDCKNKKQ